jgi:hypothetical protein
VQLGELILRERLGREKVQRAAGRIPQDRAQDGRVVAERLARCGRRRDDDVAAMEGMIDGHRLVRIQLLDSALRQHLPQPRLDRFRKRRVLGGPGGETPHGRNPAVR